MKPTADKDRVAVFQEAINGHAIMTHLIVFLMTSMVVLLSLTDYVRDPSLVWETILFIAIYVVLFLDYVWLASATSNILFPLQVMLFGGIPQAGAFTVRLVLMVVLSLYTAAATTPYRPGFRTRAVFVERVGLTSVVSIIAGGLLFVASYFGSYDPLELAIIALGVLAPTQLYVEPEVTRPHYALVSAAFSIFHAITLELWVPAAVAVTLDMVIIYYAYKSAGSTYIRVPSPTPEEQPRLTSNGKIKAFISTLVGSSVVSIGSAMFSLYTAHELSETYLTIKTSGDELTLSHDLIHLKETYLDPYYDTTSSLIKVLFPIYPEVYAMRHYLNSALRYPLCVAKAIVDGYRVPMAYSEAQLFILALSVFIGCTLLMKRALKISIPSVKTRLVIGLSVLQLLLSGMVVMKFWMGMTMFTPLGLITIYTGKKILLVMYPCYMVYHLAALYYHTTKHWAAIRPNIYLNITIYPFLLLACSIVMVIVYAAMGNFPEVNARLRFDRDCPRPYETFPEDLAAADVVTLRSGLSRNLKSVVTIISLTQVIADAVPCIDLGIEEICLGDLLSAGAAGVAYAIDEALNAVINPILNQIPIDVMIPRLNLDLSASFLDRGGAVGGLYIMYGLCLGFAVISAIGLVFIMKRASKGKLHLPRLPILFFMAALPLSLASVSLTPIDDRLTITYVVPRPYVTAAALYFMAMTMLYTDYLVEEWNVPDPAPNISDLSGSTAYGLQASGP